MAVLELRYRPTAGAFILTSATGAKREVAAFGTRGDGKTWAALGSMIHHARLHHEAGFSLPTKWMGVADTFQSHVSKTHETLAAPGWQGTWSLRDQGHVAVFNDGHGELVHLRLFGVEDQGGMDRLRAECHGLWFEEPAPASVMVQSGGLSETAWSLGMTSQRLASHCHPAIMTLNYPEEEHWTWQRFVVRRHPGTAYFRIPPGERASEEDRREWMRALQGRPDLQRRLLMGQPGVIMLGDQVAVGFNEDAHAPLGSSVRPEAGVRVWIGHDPEDPTSVIAQRIGSRIRILAALTTEHGGTRQHIDELLRPWLEEHTPWALRDRDALHVRYDPSMNTDDPSNSESNALGVMKRMLPGHYRPGPTSWAGRRDPMLALFNMMAQGEPVLAIDPVQARGLVKALRGGWHYPVGANGKLRTGTGDTALKPVKDHPHSDYGDAFCYLIAALNPTKPEDMQTRPAVYRSKMAAPPLPAMLRPGQSVPNVGHLLRFTNRT